MSHVSEVLDRIGFAMQLLDRQAMKARAFLNGARIVKRMGSGIDDAYRTGELAKVKGIGKGMLAVIGPAVDGQPIPLLEELEAEVPAGLFEVRRIKGLGAKKIAVLWRDLGLTTVAEVEYACNENRLVDLPGFGPKTQDSVLEGIIALRTRATQFRLDEALGAGARLLAAIEGVSGEMDGVVVGAARRAAEVVDKLAILVRDPDGLATNELMEMLGEDEAQVSEHRGLPAVVGRVELMPVVVMLSGGGDLWGVHQVLATGSESHLAALSARARELGGSLTAAGLVLADGPVACPDEGAVYGALGLHTTTPERREDGVPLVRQASARPRLLRRDDLVGALHNHTTASDGIHDLPTMRAAASEVGLEWLGISEHSVTAGYAGGLSAERLALQADEIRQLHDAAPDGCRILHGVESDILREGSLDYEASVLQTLDFVVASVHGRHRHTREESTARMTRAARDPYTDLIGHPTGRLLLGRPAMDFDMEALLQACADCGCAIELNASPQRLDLSAEWLAVARDMGVKISIGADAHSTRGLANLHYGVLTARRAGLKPEDVINCMSATEVIGWVKRRRQAAGVA